MRPMERPGLDRAILSEARLAIVALLRRAGGPVDFSTLREELSLSGGNLGSHLRALQTAGVLTSWREAPLGRTRTLYVLTPEGRTRVRAHARALRRVAEWLDDP